MLDFQGHHRQLDAGEDFGNSEYVSVCVCVHIGSERPSRH